MSSPTHRPQLQERLYSSDSLSSPVSDDPAGTEYTAAPPPRTSSLLPLPGTSFTSATTMDRRRRGVFSQSTPTLLNTVGDSIDSGSWMLPGQINPRLQQYRPTAAPRTTSQTATATGELTGYNGHTWEDFLRQSGGEQDTSIPMFGQSGELQSQQSTDGPTPPRWRQRAPVMRPRGSSPAAPTTPGDRKRRLTTAEGPMRRRGSAVRSGNPGNPGASRGDPIVLDASPPRRMQQSHPVAPAAPSAVLTHAPPVLSSRNTMYSPRPLTPPRRGSEIVLPPWQPDSDVSNCPVCGSQFSFFYRKHHCRYVLIN